MAKQRDSKLPRRKFLQALVATPVVVSVTGDVTETPAPQKNASRIPMLQVWADATTSIVVVMGESGLRFAAHTDPNLKVKVIKMDALSGSGLLLYRLQIEGLSSTIYSELAVFDQKNTLLDVRNLKGLDLDLKSPKIAVISCANYRHMDTQAQMWSRLEEQRPDLNLFIGDQVYSNSRSSTWAGRPEEPGSALSRYIETWNLVDLYRMDPLIPSVSVWDDHDYGTNNGDASNPYKNEMKAIYRSFYPMPEVHDRLSFGPGVSYRLTAFGIDFHMLDGRSFKVEKNTQWGGPQEAWFSQDFAVSKNPAWIINGTQFLKYFPLADSVEKNAEPSFKMLKSLVRTVKKPVAFFAGDVHSSQVQELKEDIFGFKTYEVTSSAIHSIASRFLMKRSVEEGQLFFYGKSNFILVTPSVKVASMELSLSCATEAGTFPIATTPFKIQV